ncbi:MAG: glutamate 5-kinase, partial [Lachnospiraceae bacterium]|nr:glutamate 5-kinase [Lachnospiraceae bacterium]
HQDPHAKLITEVRGIDDAVLSLGGESISGVGTGGMKTKLLAAKMCMEAGLNMVIANGKDPDILYAIAAGECVGTRFIAKQ